MFPSSLPRNSCAGAKQEPYDVEVPEPGLLLLRFRVGGAP